MNVKDYLTTGKRVLAAGATVVLLITACSSTNRWFTVSIGLEDKMPKPSSALAPLVVEGNAPRLADERTVGHRADAGAPGRKGADNSTCFVCHQNYSEEPLARRHAGANVGCVKCHGESIAHKNDEDNTTPPDTMYPPRRIDRACRECHKSHNVPARKVVAAWQRRGLDKIEARSVVCTDCHGRHRLEVRTVRWDKETGKLLK